MKNVLAILFFTISMLQSFSALSEEAGYAYSQDQELSLEEYTKTAEQETLNQSSRKSSDIVSLALTLLGVKYKWGGESPKSGFDCSGFVRFVVGNSINMNLPRTSMDMSRIGREIDLIDMLPGDLVFFKNKRGLFAHVGIYLGGKKFIHAPESGRTIGVDKIEANTYERRLSGARRLID